MTPNPSSPAAMGMDETASIAESPHSVRWEWPEQAVEEATAPLRVGLEEASHLPTAVGKSPDAYPRRGPDFDEDIQTRTRT